MTPDTLSWIYGVAVGLAMFAITSCAQLVIINWLFRLACGDDRESAVYKGFRKFKKWAYALLFTLAIVSCGAAIVLISYFKVSGT